MLRTKQLHPALQHIAPSDVSASVATSLAAWANLQQLEKLEAEALQELEELENLIGWIKTTTDALKIKHAQISISGAEVMSIITGGSSTYPFHQFQPSFNRNWRRRQSSGARSGDAS